MRIKRTTNMCSPHPQDVYCVAERSQNPGNKTLMAGKGDDMRFTASLQQLNRLPWLGSQQVWEEDSSSRPRSLFPKTVGATCLHKQLFLRNRNFNWLKPTVWNLEWKVGSPPPQHLYFGLWSFGRTARSINWLVIVPVLFIYVPQEKKKKKNFLVPRKLHKR